MERESNETKTQTYFNLLETAFRRTEAAAEEILGFPPGNTVVIYLLR